MNILKFNDKQAQASALSEKVASDLNKAIDTKGSATLCIPGGTTPGMFFEQLSLRSDIDWAKVYVLLNDERCVESTSDRLNENLLKKTLFINYAAKANLVSLASLPEELSKKSAEISMNVKQVTPIDVCILGMGEDGHTASLFPNGNNLSKALDKTTSEVIMPMHVPEMIIDGELEERLTLTLSVILAAKHHYLLITGERKMQVLEEANHQENKTLPISYVLTNSQVDVYFTN